MIPNSKSMTLRDNVERIQKYCPEELFGFHEGQLNQTISFDEQSGQREDEYQDGIPIMMPFEDYCLYDGKDEQQDAIDYDAYEDVGG